VDYFGKAQRIRGESMEIVPLLEIPLGRTFDREKDLRGVIMGDCGLLAFHLPTASKQMFHRDRSLRVVAMGEGDAD
jgi:hypothetical protein